MVPLDTGQVHPAAGVTRAKVVFAGRVSVRVTPVASDGPVLVAVMVQVTSVPGTGVAGAPDLVTANAAMGAATVEPTLAELLPAFGSVKSVVETVAVFVIEVFCGVDGATVTTSVKLDDAPEASRLESAAV